MLHIIFLLWNRTTNNLHGFNSRRDSGAADNNFFFVKLFASTERLWQEGLYIDFLQKKVADNWVKKFLINAAALFSEKLVFEFVVKFFITYCLKPFAKFSVFEQKALANVLLTIIGMFFASYVAYLYFYIFLLFF